MPADLPEWSVWVSRLALTALFLFPLYVATGYSVMITGLAALVALVFWFLVAVTEIRGGVTRS